MICQDLGSFRVNPHRNPPLPRPLLCEAALRIQATRLCLSEMQLCQEAFLASCASHVRRASMVSMCHWQKAMAEKKGRSPSCFLVGLQFTTTIFQRVLATVQSTSINKHPHHCSFQLYVETSWMSLDLHQAVVCDRVWTLSQS